MTEVCDYIEVMVTMMDGFRFVTCFPPALAEDEDLWSHIRRKVELELMLKTVAE